MSNSIAKFNCIYCDKTYGQNFNLRRHVRNHHGGAELPASLTRGKKVVLAPGAGTSCKFCGKVFSHSSSVTKHVRKAHATEIAQLRETVIEQRCQCKYCPKSFCSTYVLRRHIRLAHKDQPLSPDVQTERDRRKLHFNSIDGCIFYVSICFIIILILSLSTVLMLVK